MCTGVPFPGLERPGREDSLQYLVSMLISGAVPSIYLRLRGVHRDKFIIDPPPDSRKKCILFFRTIFWRVLQVVLDDRAQTHFGGCVDSGSTLSDLCNN